ncbi:MAG: Nramp family divalent metal transporter, partial [Bacteriovoracaceae bacterium]
MNKSFWKKLLLLIAVVGPGLITSNIDNDAGGIATYSLAGASTGLRLIWILFPVSIALVLVQEMCIRMGIVTGKGLADLIREKFGLKITFYALILLIFADLGNVMAEFAGIAAASEIFGISKYISVPICALLVWLLIVKGDYKVVERIFLVGCTFYIAYIICGIIIKPDWNQVVTAIATPSISSISRSDFPIIVGLIGTTITPWMQFFIQASVVEKGVTIKHIWYSRADVIFGCLLMFIVSAFIMIC